MPSNKYQTSIESNNTFMMKMEELVKEIIIQNNVPYYRIESRMEHQQSNSGENVYIPVIRVITYFEDSVSKISAIVSGEFDVQNERSKDKKKVRLDTFSYKHVQLSATLKPARQELIEYRRSASKTFEIHVCSMLQDAWAGIEKELGYDSATFPEEMKRDFYRVGALLEMADLEFLKIRSQLNSKYGWVEHTPQEQIISEDTPSPVVAAPAPQPQAVTPVQQAAPQPVHQPQPVVAAPQPIPQVQAQPAPQLQVYAAPVAQPVQQPVVNEVPQPVAHQPQPVAQPQYVPQPQAVQQPVPQVVPAQQPTAPVYVTNEYVPQPQPAQPAAPVINIPQAAAQPAMAIPVVPETPVVPEVMTEPVAEVTTPPQPEPTAEVVAATPVAEPDVIPTFTAGADHVPSVIAHEVNVAANNVSVVTQNTYVNQTVEAAGGIVGGKVEEAEDEVPFYNREEEPVKPVVMDENSQMTDATLKTYVSTSKLVKEIDSEIARRAGATLNNDVDIEGDVERLKYLKVYSLKQLHERVLDNKNDIIAFAEKWIGKDNGGSFDSGICLFYLEYLLVGKKNDPAFAVEYVLKFISDNDYSARFIIPTYNSISKNDKPIASHLTLK